MTTILTSKNIRYRILRAYFFSVVILFFIWLIGRVVTSEFIQEIRLDNQLYYHVNHQLTHSAILKEQLHHIAAFPSVTPAINQQFQVKVRPFYINHQALVNSYEQQDAYLGAQMEKYLQNSIPKAIQVYQKIDKQLKIAAQGNWGDKKNISEILNYIDLYESELHAIVHNYFEDMESDFSVLDIWINFALTSILSLVGIIIAFKIVKPSFTYLNQYLLQNLQSQREVNKVNLELRRVNENLKTTQQLLETEQKRSMQALQDKLTLVLEQEKYLIKGQEEERKRIAHELHDSIGQMLAGIKYGLESLKGSLPSINTCNQFRGILQLTNKTIEETRRILMGLLPSTLETFGILGAIQSLIDDLQAQHPNVHFQFFQPNTPIPPLSDWVSLGIFRIVQEALNNALKHALAKEILVEIEIEQGALTVRIVDDGSGFDLKKICRMSQSKFGIENMRQRCQLLSGDFHLESIINQGTEIKATVPLLN
ncbi:signal transduction histidine kinase [Runella defluvii]|uniref:Signal transduction histidine kinase n=1 Tax=Runella defluvii TaxID=370973 RepID=A0A7W5ZIN8_9BACT|nr:sensor histidine kinase [Runella defluvii]MBB3836456.1 signal transduction histidine kinase [Runella defluvii]